MQRILARGRKRPYVKRRTNGNAKEPKPLIPPSREGIKRTSDGPKFESLSFTTFS